LGDQLQLTVTKTGSSDVVLFNMVVTGSKGPIVIRTSPPPKKRDVPLNAVIVIVFSEPISGESLAPGVVRVTTGGTNVAGQLSFVDSTHLAAMFAPSAPLIPATDYTLTVTQGLKNVDGQPLRESVVIPFTTIDSSAALPTGVMQFEVSGMATDDANTPLPGATIYFWINPLPGQRTPGQVIATTDTDGKFTAHLTSIVGSASGPPGTADAISFAMAGAAGSELDNRYVLYHAMSDVRFRFHRALRILAGDSVLVTVTPNDGVCVNNTLDMHPSAIEWRCRTIYITSHVDGLMRITLQPCQTACPPIGLHAEPSVALPVDAARRLDSLYSISGDWTFDSLHPATGTLPVPMVHGVAMLVEVEVPWLDPNAETLWLRTSFTPAP
jgi:hypothetical protein